MTIRKSSSPGVASVTGNSGKYLTTDGVGTSWGTITIPPAGGMTLLASGSFSAAGTGLDISNISNAYEELVIYVRNWSFTSTGNLNLRFNNDSGTNYSTVSTTFTGSFSGSGTQGSTSILVSTLDSATQTGQTAIIRIPDYTATGTFRLVHFFASQVDNNTRMGAGIWRNTTTAIDRIQLLAGTGSFDLGTYELWGVK